MNYDFWETWKDRTKTEKKAIEATIKARKKVVEAVPENKLVAIYIKGSFARREMRENSDVDMVPIVKGNEDEGAAFGVNGPEVEPTVVVPLSLWEFEHNKLYSKGGYDPDLRAEPDLFLKKLDKCRLIYGKPLDPSKYPIRNDKEILKDEIEKIRKGYIPAYEEGAIKFAPLLKEVFWLTEAEQEVKGRKAGHSFEGIAKSVEDEGHIVHEAYRFITRRNKGREKEFIKGLKEHLATL